MKETKMRVDRAQRPSGATDPIDSPHAGNVVSSSVS